MPRKIRHPPPRGAAGAVLHHPAKPRGAHRRPGRRDRRRGRPVRRRRFEPSLDGHHRRHDRARGPQRRRRRPGLHRRRILPNAVVVRGRYIYWTNGTGSGRSAGRISTAQAPTRHSSAGSPEAHSGSLLMRHPHLLDHPVSRTASDGRTIDGTAVSSRRSSASGPGVGALPRDRGRPDPSLLERTSPATPSGEATSTARASSQGLSPPAPPVGRARSASRSDDAHLYWTNDASTRSPGPTSTAPGWTSPSCRPPPRCAGSPSAGAGSSGATRRAGRSGGRTSTAATSSPPSSPASRTPAAWAWR